MPTHPAAAALLHAGYHSDSDQGEAVGSLKASERSLGNTKSRRVDAAEERPSH